MILNSRNISSITWSMTNGIEELKKLTENARAEEGSENIIGFINKMDDDIKNAEKVLEMLQNIEWNEGLTLQVVVDVDCNECSDQGFIESNDVDGNDQIQKCDECNVFKDDNQAQIFASNR